MIIGLVEGNVANLAAECYKEKYASGSDARFGFEQIKGNGAPECSTTKTHRAPRITEKYLFIPTKIIDMRNMQLYKYILLTVRNFSFIEKVH